jgi:hypothetical protein
VLGLQVAARENHREILRLHEGVGAANMKEDAQKAWLARKERDAGWEMTNGA